MRADRLISLMMLLQTRGRLTAAQLAQELEVSERTIYRDIDVLSGSGVPIYADMGPGGGYGLLDSYRTTLTGLNREEIRALFMLTIPGPLADLGVSQKLKAAILKLFSALPNRQHDAQFMQQRLHMDAARWFGPSEATPHLGTLQTAVWQDHWIHLDYRRRDGSHGERRVQAVALVAKAGIWYFVAESEVGRRVYRVSRIETAELLGEQFVRDPAFDLTDFWQGWCADFEASLAKHTIRISVSPELIAKLPFHFGEGVHERLIYGEKDEWPILPLTLESWASATAVVLSLGARVKVIEPPELIEFVRNEALSIASHYDTR